MRAVGIRAFRAELRRYSPVAAVGAVLAALVPFAAGETYERAAIRSLDRASRTVKVRAASAVAPGSRVALFAGGEPLGWGELSSTDGESATFRLPAELANADISPTTAWIVGPDAVVSAMDAWPTSASLLGTLDAVAPGQVGAWVRGGRNLGVQTGDAWLYSVAGQPVARLDVRSVEASASYCAVTPLAADVPLRPGQVVELWPAPGQRRTGRASSAVAYVEGDRETPTVWIAAPPRIVCPDPPHVDFYRAGEYVGHGIAESRDGRFWYVRAAVAAEVSETPALQMAPTTAPALQAQTQGVTSQPATARALDDETGAPATQPASQPSSQPARAPSPPEIRVGDTAVIRTQDDVARQRFVARVFELSGGRALITAGERDGMTAGMTARVYRNGALVTTGEVVRVQSSYSEVRPAPGAGDAALRPGDWVVFGELPPVTIPIGSIETVAGGTLFTTRLLDVAVPLKTPLAVETEAGTVGVVVLLQREGSLATGLALEASLAAPLRPGQRIVREP